MFALMSQIDRCCSELAALYLLDLLNEQERDCVEACLAKCPECEVELKKFEAVVAILPYSTPLLPINPGLKDRLFQQIASESSQHSRSGLQPSSFSPWLTLIQTTELRWKPYFVEKIEIVKLHLDLAKREAVCLLRAEAGMHYPPHRHAGVEEILMLEGDLIIDGMTYGAGDYICSVSGSVHAPYSLSGCKFLIRASIDDEILT